MMKKMRTTKKTNKIFRFLLAFLFLFNVGFSSTNSVFATPNTKINVHLSGDTSDVDTVAVVWGGQTLALDNHGNSPDYTRADNNDYVTTQITQILINGIPVSFNTGVEANGTINYWVEFTAAPALSITKTSNVDVAHQGDTIIYTVTVKNTGNVNLKGVIVQDLMTGLNATVSLAVGESKSFNKSYKVPDNQAYGIMTNKATAVVGTISVNATKDVTILVPGYSIAKSADVEYARAGDTITYTITVTNTGNIALTDVKVKDSLVDLDDTIDLAVGANKEYVKTYVVPGNQDGDILNTATAAWGGQSQEASAIVEILPPLGPGEIPLFNITKSANVDFARAGDTITYTITVTNTGNVALEDVNVKDSLVGLDEPIDLAVGEHKDYVKTYLVPNNQEGSIINTATATWEEDSKEAKVTVALLPPTDPEETPGYSITKSSNIDEARAGDTITYTIVVTNTGNVALESIKVKDSLVGLDDTIDLAVGEHKDYVKTYVVPENQDDSIVNTATATWGEGSKEAMVIVDLLPPLGPGETPGIQVTKTVDKTTAKVGDTLTYTINVKNNGNVDLTNIEVKDSLVGLNEIIPLLEADQTKTFTKTYVIPDGTAIGDLINTAIATAIFGDETVTDTGIATTKVKPTIIDEDETPTGTLPQTGGIPFGDLAVLGSGLAALGLILRRKQ